MYLFNCYAMVTPRLRRCTSPYSIAFTFTSTTADVYEPPADVRATCCSLASIARAHALAFRHRRFWSTERIAILLLLEFRSHYRRSPDFRTENISLRRVTFPSAHLTSCVNFVRHTFSFLFVPIKSNLIKVARLGLRHENKGERKRPGLRETSLEIQPVCTIAFKFERFMVSGASCYVLHSDCMTRRDVTVPEL